MSGLKRRNGNGEPTIEELRREYDRIKDTITPEDGERIWGQLPDRIKKRVEI